MTVAVIQFPGSNCETETCDALEAQAIAYELISWNTSNSLDGYSGFILPGGFSFQDRVRAGVIAAKLPVIKELKKQSNNYNKPILGICNGAQILIESGLFSNDESLDQIIDVNYVNNQSIGFLCDWGFLKPFNQSKNIFLKSFSASDVLPIQICHGEGRFIYESEISSGMTYCQINGDKSSHFPTTPNGAKDGIAAISNTNGNCLAIMPHPERSLNKNRYPVSIRAYAKKNQLNLVDFNKLFDAFKESE